MNRKQDVKCPAFFIIKKQNEEKRENFTFLSYNFVDISRFFIFCDILTVKTV